MLIELRARGGQSLLVGHMTCAVHRETHAGIYSTAL